MPKTIKEMILENEIAALQTVDVELLILFQDAATKANAYLFSCLSISCNDETIKLILDKTYEYFNKKMMDSNEMQAIMQLNDNNSDKDDLDSDSDNSIVLNQMGKLGKDFFNFFWGTITYKEIEMTASALAFMNHKMEAVDYIKWKTHLLPVHNDFLKTKISREIIFNSITKKYGEGQHAYFESKVGLIKRRPRKFNHERERQLLKQLSTLLFFCITSNGSKLPVETEILHIRIKNVSHLVIACNSGDDLSDEFKQMKNTDELKKVLQQNIEVESDQDKEGKSRVERYQLIFKKIFCNAINVGYKKSTEETPYDIDQYKHIIAILKSITTTIQCVDNFQRDDNVKRIEDIKKIFNSKTSMIIILDNKKGAAKEPNCHAEEYLVDFILAIRSYKASVGSHKPIYTSISGKKRPCFPCYSTMLNQYVDNHGKRPGYAWKSSLKRQKDNDAKLTILSMMGMSSHVSINNKGNQDSSYDSGSDDDEIQTQKQIYKL